MAARPAWRSAARRLATSVGLAPVVDAWREGHRSPAERRDAQDNYNLALLMRFWLRPDWNCIDVGANEGSTLRLMTELAPEGHHVAFEPIPSLARRLRERFPAVEVMELALCDRSGTSDFVHVVADEGYSGLRRQEHLPEMQSEHIQVRVGRLDDCLPEGYRPDFIKIDVEGAERDVFLGGFATINKFKPYIVFEHGAGARSYGYGQAEIHRLLVDEAGLELYDIDGHGPLSRQQMLEVATGGIWNYVARPHDEATRARSRTAGG